MGGEWPARIGHVRAENGRGRDRESREQDPDSEIRSLDSLRGTGSYQRKTPPERKGTTGRGSAVEEERVGKGGCVVAAMVLNCCSIRFVDVVHSNIGARADTPRILPQPPPWLFIG